MAKLNEKTISEFVDSMMPAKEEGNHEFTANGTVASVGNNGVAVVYLDGGDANGTPCQTTVGCSPGDRVIVSFKNREPVVTSNITNPTISVTQLNAEVANINTLMAQKATITQLNTEVANINTVMAQKATITQLNTEVANINTVVAQKATISYVDTKTVNAVNVFASNGTFSGTLSAAKGVFNGKVTISWEETVPVPTSHVEVCTVTIGNSTAYPILITRQNKGSSYAKSRTYLTASGVTVSALDSNGQTTSGATLNPWMLQVGTDNNYTQISSGGGAVVRNKVADMFAVQSDLKSVVRYQKTTQSVTLAAGAKTWVTPTKPSDSDYDWNLLSCASHNSIWVLHLSQTGAYLYNSSSSSITYADTGWYWLGIQK